MDRSTMAARGTGRRQARVLGGWAAMLAVLGGLLAVAGPLAGPGRPVVAAEATPGTVQELGATLYLQNCAACHGPDGEGTQAGPPLGETGAAGADFYLRTGRMPLGAPDQRPVHQEPAFGDGEIQALVGHVAGLGDGPPIPQVNAGGDVHRGWELYTANCAACHAATGAGNAVGGGAAAVGLGLASSEEIAEAMLIGPGAMPRFDWDQADQDAIVAYVEYLRASPSPGGAPLGGFGPVAEGFVAVVIGLTLVLLLVRFVERGSAEAEPAAEPPTPPEAAA